MNTKVVIFGIIFFVIIGSIVAYFMFNKNTAGTTAGNTAGTTGRTTAGNTAGTTAGNTAGTTAGTTSSTPSQYQNIDCTRQSDLHSFCLAPNSYINLCTSITSTSDDSYSRKLQDCMKTKFATINKSEYNEARKLLIESDAKYGNETDSFYIPPYIENIDCSQQDTVNRFCQEPNNFMDVCRVNISVSDKDAHYASKLRGCVLNNSSVISSNQTFKNNFNEARKKLISKDPKYGNSASQSYIPPYIENIDCTQQDINNRFCQEPDNFIDVCSVGLSVSDKDAHYASKLRGCLKDNFGTVTSFVSNFNTARNKLIEKDPKYGDPNSQAYIPPYIQNIDCDQMEDQFRFCQEPKNFMDGCASFVRQSDKDAYFLYKIKDCVLTKKDRINLDSYRSARNYFATKYPTQYTNSRSSPLPLLRIKSYQDFIKNMNIKI